MADPRIKGLWIKLDAYYDDDDAMCNVSANAELLFVRACARSMRNRDAGAVHERALNRLCVRMDLGDETPRDLAEELVDQGVWVEIEGGWLIRSWDKWQATMEGDEEAQKSRSEQNAIAAHIRYHKEGKHADGPREGCPTCMRNADAVRSHADACLQDKTRPEKTREEITPLSSSQANTTDAADVQAVFEHWQQRLDHPQAKLDDKRRKAIKARLADGYTVDELKTAVDGILRDAHKMGNNDRGRKFDDIELACRTAANVDALIELATKGAPASTTPRGPETLAQKNARISAMFADTHHSDGRPVFTSDLNGSAPIEIEEAS